MLSSETKDRVHDQVDHSSESRSEILVFQIITSSFSSQNKLNLLENTLNSAWRLRVLNIKYLILYNANMLKRPVSACDAYISPSSDPLLIIILPEENQSLFQDS